MASAVSAFRFFSQSLGLGLGHFGCCPIRRIRRRQKTVNALLDLLHARLHFALSEVTVAIIDGFECAAVDGDDRLGEEIEVAAKHYELAADAANGFVVVLAKFSDGLKSGANAPSATSTRRYVRPHAQAGGWTEPIEVTVNIDLQQDR